MFDSLVHNKMIMHRRNPNRIAAIYYFAYFGAGGALIPYINLFYQDIGMETWQIGILAALLTASTLYAGPAWGAIADIFHLHHRLLPLLMLITLPLAFILAQLNQFALLIIFVFLFAVCLAPVVSLADHAVLTLLGDKKHTYGRLRLWGAVGWGISAWATGRLIENTQLSMLFAVYVAFTALAIAVAWQLPAPQQKSSEPYWANLNRLIANKHWFGFTLSCFLFGVSMAMLNQYFVLFITALGASKTLFGISVAAASVSEIPIFFLAPIVLRRWSPRILIAFAFIAMIIRCFLFAAIQEPIWAVPAQLLHGPTFAAMWAAGVNHVSSLSPPGLGASTQALFGATMFGLSGAVGALVGSWLYTGVGPSAMFQIAGIITFVGLIVFAFTESTQHANVAEQERIHTK
jgi:MFS transporter, PPP family, 3-phenylpropionic acid transporter